jgi:myosin heavy chain 6/7
MSPTTQSRLESRLKELEEALEQERSAHIRTQNELSEFTIQIEMFQEKLDAAETEIANQTELARRREQELAKTKKDAELLTVQYETSETSLKKRFQEQITDLSEQLDRANKAKSKLEKEKNQLTVEIESYSVQVDEANKAKSYAESKVESLDEQNGQLRRQMDELTRQNQDLTSTRSRLTKEVDDLKKELQESETKFGSSSQIKIQLQQKLDSAQSKLDEEKRTSGQLEMQISNLTGDFERVQSAYDEQSEEMTKLQTLVGKLQADNQALKTRYDKDITVVQEESEETRRRLTSRINELESSLEQTKSKLSRFEKEKSKLTIQIDELTIAYDEAQGSLDECVRQLRQTEAQVGGLQKKVEELSNENHANSEEVRRLQTELIQVKQKADDLQSKLDSANKDNQKKSESIHELEITVKNLERLQLELTAARNELQSERDSLKNALTDEVDRGHELQQKFETSQSTVNQLRIDIENVTSRNNDEIENIKKGNQRTVDELRRQVSDLEAKLKAEAGRWKKKMESQNDDFLIQIDNINKNNAELVKGNKSMFIKIKETESQLEEERKFVEKLQTEAANNERKLVSFQAELDDLQTKLAAAEKARKNAELTVEESSSYTAQINISIQTLTVDKRRLEADLAAVRRELDDSVAGRRGAEERAERLGVELARITDQLRQTDDSLKSSETRSKQYETKVRELTTRIEELEMTKDGKKALSKLQIQVTELERELDHERRSNRDLTGELKKVQRQLSELKAASEADRRQCEQHMETISTYEIRINSIKTKLQESEEMLNITMSKYRKTQQLLEEAERRADRGTDVNIVHRQTRVSSTLLSGVGTSSAMRGRRSYSVSREVSGSGGYSSRMVSY